MSRVWIGAIAVVGLSAGCSDPTAVNSPVSASVSALSPAPNASNVSRRDSIMLWTDMPMDSASCLARFSLHMGDATGPVVPGHMAFGDGYRRMMFVPDSMLRPGATYFAHAQDGMMSRGTWSGGTMMGGGMGSGMMGGQPMMFDNPPTGAMRMSDGMGWTFTTGAN